MMLIADRRSWRSQAYCSGVWPEGAQVRRRTGWSMKPLSSKKKMGVSLSRAPFLSVASLARANVVGPLRRIPLLAARASDKSNSSRVESSRRDRGDRKPEKFWRSSPPHVRRSKARFCNRHVAARPEGFLTTVVFVLRRDEVWGRDGALPSGHPSRLSSRPASIALQKTWKPLQSPQPRRFPCLPAGVVPLADGESPTRLRFRAFSCTTIRINTAYGSLAGQKSIRRIGCVPAYTRLIWRFRDRNQISAKMSFSQNVWGRRFLVSLVGQTVLAGKLLLIVRHRLTCSLRTPGLDTQNSTARKI